MNATELFLLAGMLVLVLTLLVHPYVFNLEPEELATYRNIEQTVMALGGLGGVALGFSGSPHVGAWVGLLAQPLWFTFSYRSRAWGVFAIAAAYCVIYVHTIYSTWPSR